MDALKANTPEELYQAIGEFLQSDYSHENLVKIYNNSLRCAASFRGIYSDLPVLPEPNREYPLYGLQDIMDWSKEAAKVVDDIASNLEQQTISEVISQLKKLRGVADSVLSLVDTKLKEQAQKEARAKVEKEYKNLDEEASKTKGMLLIQQEEFLGKLELKAHAILRQETKDPVQIYLSKDPAFKDRVSQLGNEICEALERLNKLIGSDTSTGKLLDIYCKLKSIPLQRQFDDVGYAYSPIDDWPDVICGGCNRLYTSIDNVIKTFEEIQTKAKLKTNETHPQEKSTGSSETRTDMTKINKKKSRVYIGDVNGDVIISQDQSGGTTAHETGIPCNKKPSKSKCSIITIISFVMLIIALLTYFGVKPSKENKMPKDKEEKISIGNVNGDVVISQDQSGGITAHTVNVNQQRAISPQAQTKKEKRGDSFILQLILSQTSGIWDSSTFFKLQVKTSGPYDTAKIVKGLPSPQFDVRTAEDKENGVFAYSTRTAPLKDEPIILEIQSTTEVDLVEWRAEPLAENK